MRALADLQRRMSASIRRVDHAPIGEVYRPSHLPAGDPLSVYCNNHRISLTTALAATFPTVAALIGPDSMAHLAAGFLGAAPPGQPCVAEYGADFPAYLASAMLGCGPAYLPDIARLDWALNWARIAPEGEVVSIEDLLARGVADLGSLCFSVHPSLTLLSSDHPLGRIYRAAYRPEAAPGDVGAAPCRLMLWRKDNAGTYVAMEADAFAAVEALAQGSTLSEACGYLDNTSYADFLGYFLCNGAFGLAPTWSLLRAKSGAAHIPSCAGSWSRQRQHPEGDAYSIADVKIIGGLEHDLSPII